MTYVLHYLLVTLSLFYPLERYFLIYWPDEEEEEGTVSVHPVEELKSKKETCDVGSSCLIAFGKKLYTKKIAAFGK